MKSFATLLMMVCAAPLVLPAQTCDCPGNFAWLTEKIRLNYPGYADKVTEETRAGLERHTERYARLTQEAQADTTCLRLLSEWTKWFKDHHISLTMDAPEEKPEDIRRRFASWETIPLTEAEARAYLDAEPRHPLEGIWQDAGRNYRAAILRRPTPTRDFAAVVLRADSVWWMPGQVKFTLKEQPDGSFSVSYYMRDHSLVKGEATQKDGSLFLVQLGDWHRVYPGDGQAPAQTPQKTFTLAQLDAQTLYLRMPTMNDAYRSEFKQLIKDNRSLLDNTPHLIVDLRGNGGGSDVTYFPLRPYLYTGPVTVDAIEIYLTEDNIDKFRQLRHNRNLSWFSRRAYGRLARKLSRHPEPFYSSAKDCQGVIKLRKASNPKTVAMLIDRGCGSSCEQLVLFAQQSDKVTLMGQNTGGVLDYANVHTLAFPSGPLRLHYPTSRSCRVPAGKAVDNVGIPPDVWIGEDTTDWVAFAKRYLEK